jgi:hypothetical protein
MRAAGDRLPRHHDNRHRRTAVNAAVSVERPFLQTVFLPLAFTRTGASEAKGIPPAASVDYLSTDGTVSTRTPDGRTPFWGWLGGHSEEILAVRAPTRTGDNTTD